MTTSNFDKIFRFGIYAGGVFTFGGYAGAVGLSSEFNPVSYIIYGAATAACAYMGAKNFTPEPPKPEPEAENIFERHYNRQNPEPETPEQQKAAFWAFGKDSGNILLGFVLGASCGLFIGNQAVTVMNHFHPPAQHVQKAPQTIKDIRDLGYWNRSDSPKP